MRAVSAASVAREVLGDTPRSGACDAIPVAGYRRKQDDNDGDSSSSSRPSPQRQPPAAAPAEAASRRPLRRRRSGDTCSTDATPFPPSSRRLAWPRCPPLAGEPRTPSATARPPTIVHGLVIVAVTGPKPPLRREYSNPNCDSIIIVVDWRTRCCPVSRRKTITVFWLIFVFYFFSLLLIRLNDSNFFFSIDRRICEVFNVIILSCGDRFFNSYNILLVGLKPRRRKVKNVVWK